MGFLTKYAAVVLAAYIIKANQVPEFTDTILAAKPKYQATVFPLEVYPNKVFHVDRHLRHNHISMCRIQHRPNKQVALHQLRQSLRQMVLHNLKLKLEQDPKFLQQQLLTLCWVVELVRSLQLE